MNKQIIKQICKKRNTMPIISNVKVARHEGKLTVECTDLENWYYDTKESEGDNFKPVLVNGSLFAEALNDKLPNVIECSRDGLRVNGLLLKFEGAANELPLFPSATEALGSIEDLSYTLSHVAYAASQDQTRYHLNGVYIEGGKAVSTDGHRLGITNTPESWSILNKFNIHSETVELIEKLKIKSAGLHKTSTTETYMLTFGETVLCFRVLPNNYPNFKAILPKTYQKTVVLNTNETLKVLKQLKPLLKGSRNKGIKVTIVNDSFSVERDGTVLSATCAVSKFDDAIEFGCNYDYLTEALSNFKNTSCKFYFNDKVSAFKIANSTADAIIMPLRV